MKHQLIKTLLPIVAMSLTTVSATDLSNELVIREKLESQLSPSQLSIATQREFLVGDHKDNGGDGFYNEQERIILRDFIASNILIELTAQELKEQTPELRVLLNKIFKVSPSVALTINNALKEIQFIMIDDHLPKLPLSQTGFSREEADVQVAIRRHDFVIISKPAFESLEDKGYLILHEVLHGLVTKYQDWSPLKHTVVRSLVNGIKNSIENTSKDEFNNLFTDHGVEIEDYLGQATFDLLSFVTSDVNLSTERCALIKLMQRGSFLSTYPLISYLENNFKGARKCIKTQDVALDDFYLEGTNQDFRNSLHFATRPRSVFVYEMNVSNSGVLSGSRKVVKKQCKQYASQSLRSKIISENERFTNLLEQQKLLLANFDQSSEEAVAAFNFIKSDILEASNWSPDGSIARVIKVNKRGLETIKENRKKCKQRFPFIKL